MRTRWRPVSGSVILYERETDRGPATIERNTKGSGIVLKLGKVALAHHACLAGALMKTAAVIFADPEEFTWPTDCPCSCPS